MTSVQFYRQPIIAQMDAGGQSSLNLMVQSHLVADVGQVTNAGVEFITNRNGFSHGKVCHVGLETQCIQDEDFESLQAFHSEVRYGLGIGYVGQVADAITENRHISMVYGHGEDFDTMDRKGLAVYADIMDLGLSRIGILGIKGIIKAFPHF